MSKAVGTGSGSEPEDLGAIGGQDEPGSDGGVKRGGEPLEIVGRATWVEPPQGGGIEELTRAEQIGHRAFVCTETGCARDGYVDPRCADTTRASPWLSRTGLTGSVSVSAMRGASGAGVPVRTHSHSLASAACTT